jgi:disulfide bond formation protein DsbB
MSRNFAKCLVGSMVIGAWFGLAACGPGADSATESAEPDGSQQVAAGDAAHGKELFVTCAACHGPDAKGLPNLGKDLTTSEWTPQQTDEQLVEFLKVGRDASDPLNTTGVAIPPKGGKPVLTDADIIDLVANIRVIHLTT